MPAVAAAGVPGIRALIGVPLGPTAWTGITPERAAAFACATDDHQCPHTTVGVRAAPRFLTLSLVPRFLSQLMELDGFDTAVNYGCEKVRFPVPVPFGSRVRARAVVENLIEVDGGVQLWLTLTIEIEHEITPACVAVVLLRLYH